jgi:PDZ domain-containing protein
VSRLFTPWRLAVTGLGILAVAAAVAWVTPTDAYIFLPNHAKPVGPLVSVPETRDDRDGGGIYFVDVLVRKATVLERLFPSLREGSSIVPADEVRPPGVSDKQRHQEELQEMRRSQDVAAAVALRQLGYRVVARPTGARIEAVDPNAPAAGKVEPGDVVVGVDGRRVRTPRDLRRLLGRHRPGETVRLSVRRNGGVRQLDVRTTATVELGRRRAIIGVFVEQAADIRLPLNVRIDAGNIGGPSAGLAFALDILEKLGRDVDHGYRVAATGSIDLDGSVGAIGGVEQKTIAVRRGKIDVFLVPAGENAAEARRFAHGLRVIPVQTFQQALRALATLPRKTKD